MAIYWTLDDTTPGMAKSRAPRPSEVVREIHELGLSAKYDRAEQEYRIDYRQSDPRWTEDTAYYTTYPQDAIDTAREMERQGK